MSFINFGAEVIPLNPASVALIQHFLLQIPDGKEGAKALTDGCFDPPNSLENIRVGNSKCVIRKVNLRKH